MRLGRLSFILLVAVVVAASCGGDADTVAPRASSTTSLSSTTSTAASPASTDAAGVSRWPAPLDALDPEAPARWTVEVVDRFDHDPNAFTQGLEQLSDGSLLESTGLRGESSIRLVDPQTGEVITSSALLPEEFGEGATVVDDTIVQLTWEAEIARRWQLPTLEPLPSWSYQGEGWGLCLAGDRLAMSDGSSTLSFRDPDDFSLLEQVTVTLDGNEVTDLNELECVDGHVIANIWLTSAIVVIRPDGFAVASIDATPLVDEISENDSGEDVLNGIAIRDGETLWLTGKLWPTLFAVRVVPLA